MNKEEAFKMLDDIARGIALTFGRKCETLIQDYSQPNHPVLTIYNGHVSGREVGSGEEITAGASRVVQGIAITDHLINCLAIRDGRRIKTTSFNFKGEDYFFCLGINFDYTVLTEAQRMLEDISLVGEELDVMVDQNLLAQVFDAAIHQIGVPAEQMKKSERLECIRILKKQNAFSFQKSVPFVAEKLNVSRFTIYSYIKELADEN